MKIESDENSHRKNRVRRKEEAEKRESGNNEKKFQPVTRVEMRKKRNRIVATHRALSETSEISKSM